MEIKFSCACGQRVAVDSSAGGQQFPCPSCGQPLEVPQQARSASLFSILKGKAEQFLSPVPLVNSEMETAYEDRITEKQRQYLMDLGETDIPSTKYEASQRLVVILTPIESWLRACFRERHILDRPLERTLQIALHCSGFREVFPKEGAELNDVQRLQVVALVRDTVGVELVRAMGPVRITENEGVFTLKPRRQVKPKQIEFKCKTCGKDHAVGEELVIPHQAGDLISSDAGPYGWTGETSVFTASRDSGIPGQPPLTIGYFTGVESAFAGLRFQIAGQTHYGWVRVGAPIVGINGGWIYDFAYETRPNTPLVAGQVLEPSLLALLGIGGVAVSFFKRRR